MRKHKTTDTPATQLRVFSSGGGVQSMAGLILSAQGTIDYPIHLFCNVGADSENPATLRYVAEIAQPYAAKHGIRFEILSKVMARGNRKGEANTVLQDVMYTLQRTGKVTIPMRMHRSGSPGFRSCTNNFKIRVVSQWLRRNGAKSDCPAFVGLGISLDEFERMRTDSGENVQILEYPLIDLRLTRADCVRIIEAAGLPVPPKSSCWFCPFARPQDWERQRREQPELFEQSANLEATVNNERAKFAGLEPMWLTRLRGPLREVIGNQADFMQDGESDACESGYCLT